ncbi:outer surface protein [Agrilactobacillus composti DSM 18527 = JCM 14202]|uniref:Outer surface protein n=1 Tax=Agrilactobacillus composti DSM 18527 = JCM 14202 TaxID=1423734 RepID=X0PU41_9LACO|nr:outer surface protein [Agrilactobacillus composti DSM 18527 = JCM 14202]GAF40881.1 outer surface protein [Agrilactobacillus composti DSM 18527 = JCM 14202]
MALGLSIYPNKSSFEANATYLKKAADLGYQRIFTSMLDVTADNKTEILATFKKIITYGNSLGLKTTIDVNPRLFKVLGMDYHHLDLLADLGASAIRLDANFDGLTESLISFEEPQLDLELNISADTGNIANILSYRPNLRRISGCHNFYPQRYTGLGLDFFTKCSTMYKHMGLKTAAFVTSQAATFGPHVFADGLPTLEMHRDLDIAIQAKHLFATGLIDDVLIANAFASDDELKALAAVNEDQLTLKVDTIPTLSTNEYDILFKYQHFNRGDINDYAIRSTFVKLAYIHHAIPVNHAVPQLKPGDITIGNDNFGQYKGELNIVKQAMPNEHQLKNVVGHVTAAETFLIDYIRPWSKFRFTKN